MLFRSRNNRALQARLQQHVSTKSYQQELSSKARATNYYHFKKAAVPFYRSLSPILSALLRQSNSTQRHDIFFWLVCHGNVPLARLLCSFGADLNHPDDLVGGTPLMPAAFFGRTAMCEALLELGADPTFVDREKNIPADWARITGHEECEQLLLM